MTSKLFAINFCLIFMVCSSFVNQEPSGKQVYEEHCVKCHGADGTKGFFGTGKLYKSKMATAEIVERIQKGKSIMPVFKDKLKEEEIKLLADYVKTLRTEKQK